MDFRIADTFTASMARLSNDEQKLVKTTAFDLQLNPSSPGMQFHKLDRAKDRNFWSVRVGRDIRLIVHKSAGNLLLCYAGHHDDAYGWAERRKIETHPATGAAQLVEVRERIQEVVVPTYVEGAARVAENATPLANVPDSELLSYGIPPDWIADVKRADEDGLLELAGHLPREAAEALLDLATGGKPVIPTSAPAAQNPFEHPDARQRFRLMTDVEELRRALDAPWETWAVFLHPAQQALVERRFNGPARVGGSAGTGKTVVALHRAVHLARTNATAKVLLTTFSDPLASMLGTKLRLLVGNEPSVEQRITVQAIDALGVSLYNDAIGKPNIPDEGALRHILHEVMQASDGTRFSEQFIWNEWHDVVDAWDLRTWDDYRDVHRLGRKTRLVEPQRRTLWQIFERVQKKLSDERLITIPALFAALAKNYADGARAPFELAVVDEAQDLSVPQLRFLGALARKTPNGLFFAGDLGQRIFQTPFSWKSLGIDVRGRSHTLRINYRTSHQIRKRADRLLPQMVSDVDGNADERHRTQSVFHGPDPTISISKDERSEVESVAAWLGNRLAEGFSAEEIGVFVRSPKQLPRAHKAVEAAGLKTIDIEGRETQPADAVSIGTMHAAKGLEFRAVVVMACDEDVIPLQERVETVADESDLAEVYDTERHLLYVACTRARDQLLVSAVAPGSEFLEDMKMGTAGKKK